MRFEEGDEICELTFDNTTIMKPNPASALIGCVVRFLLSPPVALLYVCCPKDVSSKLESGDIGALAFQARMVESAA